MADVTSNKYAVYARTMKMATEKKKKTIEKTIAFIDILIESSLKNRS